SPSGRRATGLHPRRADGRGASRRESVRRLDRGRTVSRGSAGRSASGACAVGAGSHRAGEVRAFPSTAPRRRAGQRRSGVVERLAARAARPGAPIPHRGSAAMSEPTRPRPPRVFDPDDPSLLQVPEPAADAGGAAEAELAEPELAAGPAPAPRGGIRWGAI